MPLVPSCCFIRLIPSLRAVPDGGHYTAMAEALQKGRSLQAARIAQPCCH
jgi:hypothetical protein